MLSPVHSSSSRSIIAIGCLGFLAACANTSPTIPSTQSLIHEQEQYQARARSSYAPPGPKNDPWGPYIREASERFDVPTAWIRAVIHQESGGRIYDNHGRFITSLPGAMGLMQIMPPAYDELSARYGLGPDAYNPHDNILAGTAYIREMYEIYGSPGFLAAYNYGPGSIDRYLRQHKALPLETRRYVAAIAPRISGIWPRHRSNNDLIVARHDPTARTLVLHSTEEAQPTLDPASQSVSAAWAARGFTSPSPQKTPTPPPRPAPTQTSDATIQIRSIPLAHPNNHHNRVSDIMPESSSQWGVQLGSYSSRAQASTMTTHIRQLMGLSSQHATSQVMPVHSGRQWLYRARLTGLTHRQALLTCQRLAHHVPCLPLSPSTHF